MRRHTCPNTARDSVTITCPFDISTSLETWCPLFPSSPRVGLKDGLFCLSTGWPHFTCTAVSAYVTPHTLGYSTLHLRSSVDMWSEHASIDGDRLVIIFLPITQFDAFTAGVIVQYQSLQMCSFSLPSCNWQTSNHIWHTLSFADLIFYRD